MRSRNPSLSPAGGTPWALALIIVAVLLTVFNFLFPQIALEVRARVVDLFAPVLQIAAKPAEMLQTVRGDVSDLAHLREENARLHKENDALKAWAEVARRDEEENKSLKNLLKYKDESVLSFLTARVIGANSNSFSNSVIVTAGSRDGVEKDMVVLDEDGVIGRVIEAGDWSARILLLTDLNFRLPVMVEGSNQRAILAGQGRDPLKLLYAAQESEIKPGMRVVTSGHGGIFPPGLPVGVIKDNQDHTITVQPLGHLERLDLVRLAHYALKPVQDQITPAPTPAETPAAENPTPPDTNAPND